MAKRRPRKRRDEECDGRDGIPARGFVVATLRKNVALGVLEVKCPRCHCWQTLRLDERNYSLSPNGLVTPDFVCMADHGRHCDFMDTIMTQKE